MQQLELLAEKALFCHTTGSLFIADLHLGKAGHFRRAGIPLPGGHSVQDLQRLGKLVLRYEKKLRQLIFLGDVFHSRHNSEWELFCQWRETHAQLPMKLVEGNHDILPPGEYRRAGVEVLPEGSLFKGMELRHHPKPQQMKDEPATVATVVSGPSASGSCHLAIKIKPDARLYVCGHLHPGVALYGAGRQREQLPCFWQRGSMLMLPAFGSFTGLHHIKPKPGDGIWGVAGPDILALHEP
ncbi:MAG: metallophosphoesterase [Cyclonatronaceae bacterium]